VDVQPAQVGAGGWWGAAAGPPLGSSWCWGSGAGVQRGEPGGCYHLAASARSGSRSIPALPRCPASASAAIKSHRRENKQETPEQKPQPLCTVAAGKMLLGLCWQRGSEQTKRWPGSWRRADGAAVRDLTQLTVVCLQTRTWPWRRRRMTAINRS